MAQADAQVIIPRRNFLIRALGFTAAGATLVLPVIELKTPQERLQHHMRALKREFQAVYPGAIVEARTVFLDPVEVLSEQQCALAVITADCWPRT